MSTVTVSNVAYASVCVSLAPKNNFANMNQIIIIITTTSFSQNRGLVVLLRKLLEYMAWDGDLKIFPPRILHEIFFYEVFE